MAGSHCTRMSAFPLFGFTYTWTIRAALGGITVVTRIIDTDLIIGALGSRDPATGYGFSFRALALMVDGNSSGSCLTGIAISFAVATADGIEFLGASGWFGFADPLCICNFALADAKITVLSLRTRQPADSTAYGFGWFGRSLAIATSKQSK